MVGLLGGVHGFPDPLGGAEAQQPLEEGQAHYRETALGVFRAAAERGRQRQPTDTKTNEEQTDKPLPELVDTKESGNGKEDRDVRRKPSKL